MMSPFSQVLIEMLDERVPADASPEAHVLGLAQILRDTNGAYEELCERTEKLMAELAAKEEVANGQSR